MALVLSQLEPPIQTLVLHDPDRRNPLSPDLLGQLLVALEEAAQNPQIRAIVLTGAGSTFSAGVDLAFLSRVAQMTAQENLEHSRALQQLFYRVYTFPKPIVAAVQGHAIAGGAGLASACDLVVMAEGARLGYTEVRIGFVAALVGVILVRSVGEKHARELLLTGKQISAQEAYRMGLVNRVVAADRVVDTALELAREIAANAPSSVALTRELLTALPGMGLEDGFRLATVANAWIRQTDDLEEGIRAFFEKRPPRF